jgi:putative adhesin
MTTFAPPPAPPAAAPPPLSPGGRTAVRAILVIAASALVLGSIVALGTSAWGITSLRVNNDRKDLPQGMRSLTIDASDVTVHLTSDPKATAPRVDLRTLTSTRGVQPHLEVTTDGGATRILVTPDSGGFLDFSQAGDVTVTLPPKLAATLSLTTHQEDGTLVVDADLDRLVADSSDGDIILNGSAHVVEVTTRDGNVASRKPLSVTDSFLAESVDGNVAVAFADPAPRKLEATTRDGDVAITLPPTGPYLVDAQSHDGATSVRVPETTDPARATSQVTVRSTDGNVAVDTRRHG